MTIIHHSLTHMHLDKIRELIYKETGIFLETKKDYILRNRLGARMSHCGVSHFRDYHKLLTSDNEELQNLIESITVNETYFFRDFPQLQGFAEKVLPAYLAEKKAAGDFHIRIWSAACSTGAEPYTLSIILREMIEDYQQWHIYMLATDIDRQVIRIARKGEFSDRALHCTPTVYKDRYFAKNHKYWKISDAIAKSVDFQILNLMDGRAMRAKRCFDFIFCRNVLIYFSDISRKRVVNNFYDSLLPGGFLFLGASESVGRISAAFKLEKYDQFLCYRKPRS